MFLYRLQQGSREVGTFEESWPLPASEEPCLWKMGALESKGTFQNQVSWWVSCEQRSHRLWLALCMSLRLKAMIFTPPLNSWHSGLPLGISNLHTLKRNQSNLRSDGRRRELYIAFTYFICWFVYCYSISLHSPGWPGIYRGLSTFTGIKGICYHAWLDFFYSILPLSVMG